MYCHYVTPENQEKSPLQNVEKHEPNQREPMGEEKNS